MADNNLVLRIIMNASDRASNAMNRVRDAASGLSGRLGRLQQAFDRSARNRNNLTQYINQRQAMRQLDAQMQNTQQRIQSLAQTQRQQGSLTREQQREWTQLQRSMRQSNKNTNACNNLRTPWAMNCAHKASAQRACANRKRA